MKQGDPTHGWWPIGSRGVLTHPDWGYPMDREFVSRHLQAGHSYRVKDSWVWPEHSEVELVEHPGVKFNAVHFECQKPYVLDEEGPVTDQLIARLCTDVA